MMSATARSLFVVNPRSPFPPDHGGSIRYWNLLRALQELGPVDVWLVDEPDAGRAALLAAQMPDGRVHADAPAVRPWTMRADLAWVLLGRTPRWPELPVADIRARFAAWRAPAYDVVLSVDPMCHALVGHLAPGLQVVDLDDVPDRTFGRELRHDARQAGRGVLHPRQAYRLGRGAVNLRRYRRLQAGLRDRGVLTLACSVEDQQHLGGDGHSLVVPNGFEREGPPLGRARPEGRPTILMQGALRYAPNIDAARHFAHDILPLVRALVGEVRFLVVGEIDEPLRAELAAVPDVEVTGRVPDMADALRRTDLVVAPLRLGGGTRIKVLEAFSHRIPVVATSVGAEGLDAVSGRHLLVADRPDDFAWACARLLTADRLRRDLVDAAFALVSTRYGWERIRHELATELRARAGAGTPSTAVS